MRLVFLGTSEFAVPILRALASDVILVMCQPDRPSGRGLKLQPAPVKLAAAELGIPVLTPVKASSPEIINRFIPGASPASDVNPPDWDIRMDERPDAFVVAAYGQILSQAFLDSATRGGINIHGSILPKYRGAAPIQRAILDGETETGVTLMQMDKGMDTGDIIAISRTPIGPDETYGELQERLAHMGAELAKEWMARIVAGDYPRQPQGSEQATYAPKINREETEIHFDRQAQEEYRRFRAFTPSPGAYIVIGGVKVKLTQVRQGALGGKAGEVLALSPDLCVAFEESSLIFKEVQPAGKPRMSGRDWANGLRLRMGDILT